MKYIECSTYDEIINVLIGMNFPVLTISISKTGKLTGVISVCGIIKTGKSRYPCNYRALIVQE